MFTLRKTVHHEHVQQDMSVPIPVRHEHLYSIHIANNYTLVETGTRSAVAGGTTTVLLFAEQAKGQSLKEQVANYHLLAQDQGSYADYGFHAIITDPTQEVLENELPTLARDGGIMSMKLFLTYKHMRISDKQFLQALKKARELEMVALVHAENGDLVDFFTEQLEEMGLTNPMYKAIAHPPEAEAEAVNRAVTFSSIMDTPMLIVHVSVEEPMRVIQRAQSLLKPVFAETCPQYLLLGKKKLEEEHFCGAKYICSPPLRSGPKEIESIWRGIVNGTFTIFSSDHCPYRYINSSVPVEKYNILTNDRSFNDPQGKQLGFSSGCDGKPKGV